MSAGVAIARIHELRSQPWLLWGRQVRAVLRLDLKKNFLTRRGAWIYLLAFAPVVIIGAHALESPGGIRCNIEEDTRILAAIVELFYVRLAIFFGCMGIFTWLFRGEVVERTLHYYFLTPMRRELLVIGKFLAGAITAATLFGAGVLASFTLMYAHFVAPGRAFVFAGPGLGHLAAYLLTVVLACLGFGAMFVALSLIFRNPIVPGALLLGWETISSVLPATLQKLTVTFYLKQLAPVDVPKDGLLALFTVVTEPIAPWVAVFGLLCLTVAVLAYACVRIRHIEISYTSD